MSTFKVTLAYDGTDFVGWQRQASGVSIQGVLEDALRTLDDRAVTVIGAGRTDAGVHALGQVASFSLARAIDVDTLVRALNANLPEAVRVLSAAEAPPAFNARFDARAKTYRYRIWNGPALSPFERRYAWHYAGPLDVGAMDAAARRLEGRHDFAAFQTAGSDVVTSERTITSSRVRRLSTTEDTEDTEEKNLSDTGLNLGVLGVLGGGELVRYDVTGDGFLRHMVRAIVGTLIEIGRGRRPAAWIDEVLASRDRHSAGSTVPAAGGFLVRVDYGGVSCE
jgi:tRNA pseudouridine38-40 synthase